MAGKYDPLHQHLAAAARRGDDSIQLRFDEIDRLVGELPFSARNYREWWSNSSQPHAWAWREAGWLVVTVSQDGGYVRFEREAGLHTKREGARPAELVSEKSAAPAASLRPLTRARAPRSVIDAGSLPVVDRTDVRVSVEWREAGLIALDADGELLFPLLPPVPGLYRMTLLGGPAPQRPRLYIGETDDLRQRAHGYRTPGGPSQTTNVRLNAALKAQLGAGGVARLAIAAVALLHAGGAEAPALLDLSRKASRLLAESAALVAAQLAGNFDLENLE